MAAFGGIDAGTAFVTILPNATKFGPALQGQVSGAVGSTQKRLQQFRVAAGVALGLAGVAVIKFGADSIKAYQESEQVLSQLQNTIAKTPGYAAGATAAFQKQASALQNLTGFEDEQILSADNSLIRFGLMQDQVSALTPLILDFARATGTDATEAATAIGRALLGNTRALKTIGIEFKATGDRGKDLATIMDLLKGKVGGAAEAFGKTSAGQIEIFRARLNDLQETIGKALVPVLNIVVKSLDVVLGVFNSLPGPAKEVATVVVAVGVAFVGLGLALKVVRSALIGYTGQAGAATVATEAMTVATTESAGASVAAGAAATRFGGILATLGPLGIAAGAALTSFAVGAALQAKAAKEAKDGNEGLAIAVGSLGNAMNPTVFLAGDMGNRIDLAGIKAKAATPKILGFRDAASTMIGEAVPKINDFEAAVRGSTDALKNQAAAAVGSKDRIAELGNMAQVKAGQVDKAFRQSINVSHEFDSSVQGLHSQIVALPNGKIVNIVLPNIAKMITDVNRLKGEVFAVAGTYGITFNIKTNGNVPSFQRTAKGGAFPRYGAGTTFLGPTGMFQAGEASYPTPFGTGGEIVSNRGVLPLNAEMIGHLGAAIAKAGGSSGASGQDIAAAMWPMIRELSRRPIVVQIDRREIARAVADHEVWTR